MNQQPDQHPPRHLLEAVAAGQTDQPPQAQAAAHAGGCPTCSSRLAAMTGARAEYLGAYPAQDFVRQVAARAERAPRPVAPAPRRRWLAGLAAGTLVVAVAAVFLLLRPAPDDVRLKGGVSWSVFAKRGPRTWPVTDGESLKAGDRLAFAYVIAGDRYLLLLGVDDAGAITQYGGEGGAPLLLRRGRGTLPFGIELDARRGEERLFALFSPAALDVEQTKQALAAAAARARAQNRPLTAGDLKLPGEIASFGFRKT